jgi:YfiH family protein
MIEKVKIIKPEIFSKYKNLICGVSTRYGPNSIPPLDFNLSFKVGDNPDNVRQNRKDFFEALGIDGKKVTFQFQTHSTIHNYVEETKFFNGSDGLYTDKKDLFLAINVADCIPVFVYDPVNEIAAGIHSGWKGTQQKIVTHTVQTLMKKYNSKPEKLVVFIGPGISVKNFEVGKDVFDFFDEEFREVRNGKYYVDLKKDIYTRLLGQGLRIENIEVSEYCTVEDKELFHSYRRDRENSGRMLGVIGMKL